ncbi:hypothetical protein GCM10023116_15910 [Kistimonas scapharcae]|uniref:Conjugal transfer protein n=2 Tax=Kistimonas scapharcae TaxID=1036133 RepID=A0ABP8V0B6_9GAMM
MDWAQETTDLAKKNDRGVPIEYRSIIDNDRDDSLADSNSDIEMLVFISTSMGETSIRGLLESIAGQDNAVAIIRGLLPGDKSLNQTIKQLHTLMQGIEPIPNMILDPTLFQKYDIDSVPTVVVRSHDDEKELARFSGVYGLEWIKEQLNQGASGDMGAYGTVEHIAERNLIDEMQERASKLDIDRMKAEARARVWEKYDFTVLPSAITDRTRLVDPTVVVPKSIKDHEGNTIVEYGVLYNPLNSIPFTRRLVIFDATQKEQVAFVQNLPPIEQKMTVYMTTSIHRDNGWQHLKQIQDQLNAPVFLLNMEIVRTFQLQAVPSVVTANEHHFIVQEYGVGRA